MDQLRFQFQSFKVSEKWMLQKNQKIAWPASLTFTASGCFSCELTWSLSSGLKVHFAKTLYKVRLAIWIDAMSCNSDGNLRWDLHEVIKWDIHLWRVRRRVQCSRTSGSLQTHAVDPAALQPSNIHFLFHRPLIASGYNPFAKVARQESNTVAMVAVYWVYSSKKRDDSSKTKPPGSLKRLEHQQPIHFEIVELCFHLPVFESLFSHSRFELRLVTSSNCSIKMHLLFSIFERTRKKRKDENNEDEKKLSSWFLACFFAKKHSTWMRNSIKKSPQWS